MAGNPASISAGIACLEVLKQEGVYEEMDRLGAILEKGLLEQAAKHSVSVSINRLKGALTLYFTDEKIVNYEQAEATDGEIFGRYFKQMLNEGINLAPSKYEAMFLTTAHTEEDVMATIEASGKAFSRL